MAAAASASPSATPSASPTQFSPLLPHHPVVPLLLPRASISLLVGAPYAGKTGLLLPALARYLTHGDFLGWPAARHPDSGHPMLARLGYLSCDRTLNEIATDLHAATAAGLHLPPDLLPYVSGQNSLAADAPTLPDLYELFPRPRPQLLVVEALQALCQGKVTDNQEVARFCAGVKRWAQQQDVTILGTVLTAKAKEGEGRYRSVDRPMGASTWANQAATLFDLSLADDDKPQEQQSSLRKLVVYTRHAAPAIQYYDFNDQHLLVPITEPEGWRVLLAELAGKLEPGFPIPTREILGWSELVGARRPSVEKWLYEEAEALGLLEKVKRGTYRRPYCT